MDGKCDKCKTREAVTNPGPEGELCDTCLKTWVRRNNPIPGYRERSDNWAGEHFSEAHPLQSNAIRHLEDGFGWDE